MNPNSIGIEMLNLGKSDAIFVTITNQSGEPLSLLIDGGLNSEAEEVIRMYNLHHSQSSTFIVVSTHPDSDHIKGLPAILSIATNQNKILLQNAPHDFGNNLQQKRKSRLLHSESDRDSFDGLLQRSSELSAQAYRSNFKRYTAFATPESVYSWGEWKIYIVGPDRDFITRMYTENDMFATMYSKKDGDPEAEEGTIDDGSDTSHINNSSIMILIEGPTGKYLFTGDAGVQSINHARTIRELRNLTFLDVPHHGSRRNMDSEIIESFRPSVALISSDGSKVEGKMKHPGLTIVQKLKECGTTVCSTCINDNHVYHNTGLPRDYYRLPVNLW